MAKGGISGVGAAVAAAGLYLVYAGIRDVPVVDGLRQLVAGTIPTGRPATVTAVQLGTALGQAAGNTAATVAGFTRPVPGRIGDGFGVARPGGRKHKGVDMISPSGTPVLAALAGVVSGKGYGAGPGNYIQLRHEGAVETTKYFHLSNFAVSHGQRVTAGQTIGYVGSTGDSSGPHLHFEVWVNGAAVDPAAYLGG